MKAFILCLLPCQGLKISVPEDVSTNSGNQSGLIPKQFLLNYEKNILENPAQFPETYQNIQSLSAKHPDFPLIFYDDQQCEAAIARVHSKQLAQHFAQEKSGAYKSDTCRLAMLYEHGGFYLDNDLEAIADLNTLIPSKAGFATILAVQNPLTWWTRTVFNAFMASKPGHPVVKDALNRIAERYQSGVVGDYPKNMVSFLEDGKAHQVNNGEYLGPATIHEALKSWLGRNLQAGYMEKSQPFSFWGKRQENIESDGAFILEEQLWNHKEYGLEKRYCCDNDAYACPKWVEDGGGRCDMLCNSFVATDKKEPVFWGRFVSTRFKCPSK